MKKSIIISLVCIFIISCDEKKTNASEKKDKLVMYEASEMTTLMLELLEFHKINKQEIERDTILTKLPEKFFKMHTAEMTKGFDRDSSFINFTNLYFNQMEYLHQPGNNTKANYNNAVNTCIACHQTTCNGPIVRIEKLLID